ncbi:Fmu (Sun) domain-containing protein [Terrimonas pollutisoli]|uniref:Fmu (Sun) domain-containing protein n=1 Tax=Terrimonas pollutisoli TaxID=3034147 RepID=UPI0023EA7D4A|nr:Fmu (Sun) domain-containing protein [Terrimonas sp. H1YJ31]
MNRYFSYLNSAVKIINHYKGDEPFSSFLKKYFSLNKKYGSKDRKQIGHLCYCYFRLGKAGTGLSMEERILTALFLCSDVANEFLQQLKPGWNEQINVSIEEKIALLNSRDPVEGVSITDVFPWREELSTGIVYEEFCASFFKQPDLFLRLRPGKEKKVMEKLERAGISFKQVSDTSLVLSNSSKLDEVIELNKDAVVQDYSSQRVGEFLEMGQTGTVRPGSLEVWDCCAASGGKSIMAKDILGNVDLTVSDIRDSILHNLKKRFIEAGVHQYKSFKADLANKDTNALPLGSGEGFDLIICDAPCTGSGTWSRTPEQLYFFEKEKISYYSGLQKRIVSNAIKQLTPDGYFLYITCSVFKKENEEVVEFIKDNFSLELVESKILDGYNIKADTMFAALLKMPS